MVKSMQSQLQNSLLNPPRLASGRQPGRHAARLLALAASVALATGCALQPAYQRPAAPVAASFPGGAAYRADSGHGPAAADTGWRDFLRDARLQQLVTVALANNRDLRVAALNVEKVRAQYRLSEAALLPQVGLAAGATGQSANALSGSRTAVERNLSLNLAASWEPDFFGRLHSLSDAALQQYLASGHARQAAQILLVSQVADQYLSLLAGDEQLAVTGQTLGNAQAAFKLIELQFNTGTASALDLSLAQNVLETATANRAAQTRARAQAENALVLLIGQPLPADLAPATRLSEQAILADIPAGLPSDLLMRRPDMLQAEAVLRSQHANIGVARAAFFPRITLTGVLGSAAPTLGGLFEAGTKVWSFAPALTAPLFDAGANRANLDLAVLQKDISVAQYEKAIQAGFREVADGLAARGTYDDQLAALQRLADSQQRRFDLASLRYTNGVEDYLAVLTAQTDLYNAQQALITARLNRLTSLVDLYRALGGGWLARSSDAPATAPAIADPADLARAGAKPAAP